MQKAMTVALAVLLLCSLWDNHGQDDVAQHLSRLLLVDKENRTRISLTADDGPALTFFDEKGTPIAVVGVVKTGDEFAKAVPGSPYVHLGSNDRYLAIGFEGDEGETSGRGVPSIQIIDASAELPKGTMARLAVSPEEASLSFMQLGPFPFVRLFAEMASAGPCRIELRDDKGELAFSTAK